MVTSARIVAIALILLTAGHAGADSLRMHPGKWEVTTTINMPMLASPQVETETECVRDENFDPRSLMEDSDDCRVTDQSVTGNTITWAMECTSEGGRMAGTGSFTADETTARGGIDMKMDMAGQSMSIQTSWRGKRLGDCD